MADNPVFRKRPRSHSKCDIRVKWLRLLGQEGKYKQLRASMGKEAALEALGKSDVQTAKMVLRKAELQREVTKERAQYCSVRDELKETDKVTRDLDRVKKIISAPTPEADRSDLPDDLAWVYDHPLLLKQLQQPDKVQTVKDTDFAGAPSLGAKAMLSQALAEPKWLLDKVLKHMMDRDRKAAPDKGEVVEETKELTADDIQLEEIEAMLKGVK